MGNIACIWFTVDVSQGDLVFQWQHHRNPSSQIKLVKESLAVNPQFLCQYDTICLVTFYLCSAISIWMSSEEKKKKNQHLQEAFQFWHSLKNSRSREWHKVFQWYISIYAVRFHERSFDVVATSLITSETDMLTPGKRVRILSKSHSVQDFLSDEPISILALSLF